MSKLKPVYAEWPPTLPCKIALVGEAPGAEEAMDGKPFVGASGKLLDQMLDNAGIKRADCLVTNVFTERPPRNDVTFFFDKPTLVRNQLIEGGMPKGKAQSIVRGKEPPPPELGPRFTIPLYGTIGYLKEEYIHELHRLHGELRKASPDTIIVFGNTALWAVLGITGITKHRGTFAKATFVGAKVLPTFHPAAVMRDWSMRPTVIADLRKAAGIAPDKNRTVYVPESVEELEGLCNTFLKDATHIAVDVETEALQITSLSLSPDPLTSIAIPFWDKRRPNYSAWSEGDEIAIRAIIARFICNPAYTKIYHNALYDLTYLYAEGLVSLGPTEDTMLMHHSLQPELPKSLGYLGSIYANTFSWKNLRVKAQVNINKKDE